MTISWFYCKIQELVDEAALPDFGKYLGAQELEVFRRLKIPKRRTEWLAGRVAAKTLLRASDTRCASRKPAEIQILSNESGAPWVKLGESVQPFGSLSLSHSNGFLFCAHSSVSMPLGVDLEVIAPRERSFIEDYFTKAEVEQVNILNEETSPLGVNLVWSGKESILKALQSGLRVDTRTVEVQLPQSLGQGLTWSALGTRVSGGKENSLHLVWRREGDFVLTVCAPEDTLNGLVRVNP